MHLGYSADDVLNCLDRLVFHVKALSFLYNLDFEGNFTLTHFIVCLMKLLFEGHIYILTYIDKYKVYI